MSALHTQISEAMNVVRLPSSQISLLLYGYVDMMEDPKGEQIRQRLANRDFAIDAFRCAKEAILISTLRPMFQTPADVDTYIDDIREATSDQDLRDLRSGLISLMLH